MKDLTRGSIVSHILSMAPPIVVGMITIMICQLVDLYFVAGLGEAAVAGVAAAGNAGFLVNALMQVLGVGTVALMAHAVGRKDRDDADLVFNQSVVLSVLFGMLTLVAGFVLSRPYMRAVAADEATVEAGTAYLLWFMPALALQFATQVMAVRIAGDRHRAAEHAGAGACRGHQHRAGAGADHGLGHRTCARRCRCGPCQLDRRLRRRADAVRLFPQAGALRRVSPRAMAAAAAAMEENPQCRPARRRGICDDLHHHGRDLLRAGVFGPAAQAGFGIGTRVLGLIQMPALAIALAAGPIAGQNFGAGNGEHVCGKPSSRRRLSRPP